MPIKEGKIIIEIVCYNCGAVMKNAWTYKPKENDVTKWNGQCPVCHFPIEVEFKVN